MNDANQKTLESYNNHIREYIDSTPQAVGGVVQEWIDEATGCLDSQSHILELGSGTGQDAAYLRSKGLNIECTDAPEGFVALLMQKGFNARQLNAITDDLGGPYDLILAKAVLLHFNRHEFKQVVAKAFNSLKVGGKFAFTVKQGEGEEWTDAKLNAPRYFCYWTGDQINPILLEAGFTDVKIARDAETKNATWVQVIAQK